MGTQSLIGGFMIFVGVALIVVAVLIHFNIINVNETFANDYEWKYLGKTAWFPVFGNTYVYNNTLQYKKEGDHYRYRVISHNGAIYDITRIDKLFNGTVIQIANPTNPMTVEMAVQINDGKYWTSN